MFAPRHLLALLLLASAANASVVISESLEEMVHGSARILRGNVANVRSVLDEKNGRIYTYVDLEVTEVLKGEKVATAVLKEAGGTVGGISQEIIGAPHFATGEDIVVFLEPSNESNMWLVRSLSAGKVTLLKSAKGELRAKRQFEGLAFFDRKNGVHERAGEDLGTAQNFLSKIRSVLGAK